VEAARIGAFMDLSKFRHWQDRRLGRVLCPGRHGHGESLLVVRVESMGCVDWCAYTESMPNLYVPHCLSLARAMVLHQRAVRAMFRNPRCRGRFRRTRGIRALTNLASTVSWHGWLGQMTHVDKTPVEQRDTAMKPVSPPHCCQRRFRHPACEGHLSRLAPAKHQQPITRGLGAL